MANRGIESLHNIRKNISNNHELISTCYHEAGHVIYGLLHFMEIEYVAIIEEDNVGGCTIYDPINFDLFDDLGMRQFLMTQEVAIKYAGLVAEKIHYKNISGSDKFPMFLRNGSSDDNLSASALIRKYDLAPPGKKRYNYKIKLIKEVTLLMEKYWNEIIIISHALFKKKKLFYNDLKLLLTKNGENKKFWKSQFKKIDYLTNNSVVDSKELHSILS